VALKIAAIRPLPQYTTDSGSNRRSLTFANFLGILVGQIQTALNSLMFDLLLASGEPLNLLGSNFFDVLGRILIAIAISAIVSLWVEVRMMNYLQWGNLRLCLIDVFILNAISRISLYLFQLLAHQIFPSVSINALALATMITLLKSFIAYKFSDRPWIIVSISTIVSYLSFVAILSCLYWFWLGFR
jgi:hypothetical protein